MILFVLPPLHFISLSYPWQEGWQEDTSSLFPQLIKGDRDVEMAGVEGCTGEGPYPSPHRGWRTAEKWHGGLGGSPYDATAGASLSCLVFSHVSCRHAWPQLIKASIGHCAHSPALSQWPLPIQWGMSYFSFVHEALLEGTTSSLQSNNQMHLLLWKLCPPQSVWPAAASWLCLQPGSLDHTSPPEQLGGLCLLCLHRADRSDNAEHPDLSPVWWGWCRVAAQAPDPSCHHSPGGAEGSHPLGLPPSLTQEPKQCVCPLRVSRQISYLAAEYWVYIKHQSIPQSRGPWAARRAQYAGPAQEADGTGRCCSWECRDKHTHPVRAVPSSPWHVNWWVHCWLSVPKTQIQLDSALLKLVREQRTLVQQKHQRGQT